MERRRRYPSIHHDSDISRPERRSKTLRGEGICICSPIDDDASRCRGCGRSAHLLGKGGREPPGSRQQPPNIYTTSRLRPWQGRKLRVLCALDFHGNSDPFPTALRASRSHTRCVVGWEQTIWAHPEPSHTIVDSRERRAPAQAKPIAFPRRVSSNCNHDLLCNNGRPLAGIQRIIYRDSVQLQTQASKSTS